MATRRFIYIILLLACQSPFIMAQVYDPNSPESQYDRNDPNSPYYNRNGRDTSNVEIISLPPKVHVWKLSKELGNIIPELPDTMHLQFQNTNLVEGMTGHYNYLGNLGAPRLSRVFFDRKPFSSKMFLDPYDSFITDPSDHYFTNSNIPYTNITYYKTFDKQKGEERFKTYFSVNANKNLAFGFNFDYLYGRGYYNYQSTSFFNAGVFGSYVSDKYQAHLIYNNYYMKMRENGGIEKDIYITDPDDPEIGGNKNGYKPDLIPVNLSQTGNRNSSFYVYLTHRYNLGFHREVAVIDSIKTDSIRKEFVPVTSFIHTATVDRARHRYTYQDDKEGYYSPEADSLKHMKDVRDSTVYVGIKNTFGISLLEGFNKYAKAGLTAYISHKISKYSLMDTDSVNLREKKYTEQEVYVGGELLKRQGNLLHYKAIGEVGIAGEAIGQFRVEGDADLNFSLWKDTVNFMVRGAISNTVPAFYMRHYHGKYHYWDNESMDKEFRTRIEAELNIDRLGTNLRAGVENIKNYTYFDGSARPAQEKENIQVITARLNQNFKLGILHLDNEVVWQKSSNETVLPLPDLSLYHNLYIDAKLSKKVLSLQMGVDVRYFTKYKAPAYSPGIQNYHLQAENDQVEIGNYPIVNAYLNFHLKRTRFFVMMYHLNQGMSKPNYFLTPHYPINQRLLKFGLSWNFFD